MPGIEFSCHSIGCFSYRFRFPHLIDSTSNPVEGSEPGENVYIARAYVNGDIIPGKAAFRSGRWRCWVGYNGKEYHSENGNEFEVLTNPAKANLIWVRALGSIPGNAIAGGRTVDAETYYIARCRQTVEGWVVPGKVYQNQPNTMYYPYGHKEHKCTDDFDFLVCS
jgi:hypothetical protein